MSDLEHVSPHDRVSVVDTAAGHFSLEVDVADPHIVYLATDIPLVHIGERLWSRRFGDLADRDAMLEQVRAGALDLVFLGRVTMHFGAAAITAATERAVADARESRRLQAEAEARNRRDHAVVELFAHDTKHGHRLDLQRRSDGTAEWSVRYDRAIERDRLCDWLRWQTNRFETFLDHAGRHGDEALTRMLTDEMFETERRIKKEGRGAGGQRPLRMWRGD